MSPLIRKKSSMIRRTAIAGVCFTGAALVGALGLGGCADFMQRSAVAPDWFSAKMEEVKGTGYPDLHDIPTKQGSTTDQAKWDATAASVQADVDKINQRLAEVDRIIAEEGFTPPEASAPAPGPAPGAAGDAARASAAQSRATTGEGSAPAGQPPQGL
jgi:hypothetical protein